MLLNENALYRDLTIAGLSLPKVSRRSCVVKVIRSPYEALKALTRTNEGITEKSISDFIGTLQVSDAVKAELKAITPHNYTGI